MVRAGRSFALPILLAAASASTYPLGCSGSTDSAPGAFVDAGGEAAAAQEDAASAGELDSGQPDARARRPCRGLEDVPEGAIFCDDFDATDGGVDGGLARWAESATGGSVTLLTGDAVSAPAFVRTKIDVAGGEAALVRELPGTYTIIYEADIRVVKRPTGSVQLQRISIPPAHFVLFLELGTTADRLVEQYFDAAGAQEDAVPLNGGLPEGAWVHVEMGADIGDSAFRFWLALDGIKVASKRLRGAPGSATFFASAGQVTDISRAGVGGIVDVDNVLITLK